LFLAHHKSRRDAPTQGFDQPLANEGVQRRFGYFLDEITVEQLDVVPEQANLIELVVIRHTQPVRRPPDAGCVED
jgi:hypothetical protein